ncbi:hypothetical protein KUTeg_018409 [Tegillarca granosa]|uniref:Uncharacterized protein n=1 Tax=Tegillarca granosa TaxID=220873 RepID=A0ABQ9ELR8_TEGGR|nr:hypothetical protein KUTeg_018409 [Tegillarca granosa]
MNLQNFKSKRLFFYISSKWNDCRLKWNASQFQGIDRFIIPYKRVWIPDMTLYDNSAAHSLPGMKDYSVKVSNDGKVQYNFPTVITSLCAINVKFFPFDYQKCGLTFGSWAYPGSDINITSDEPDTESYVRNTEWEVLGIPFERNENFFPSLNESYPTITYYLNLKRKPLFYVMNMLFPCLLITFVATFGFMLPPDSGEKVNLSITVLLSLAVFQLIVLETIPASGDSAPYIGELYIFHAVNGIGWTFLFNDRHCTENPLQREPWSEDASLGKYVGFSKQAI